MGFSDSDGGSTASSPRLKSSDATKKKSNPKNSKSEAAEKQEKGAIAAFNAQKQATEARAAEGGGDAAITVQLLKPSEHLVRTCWSSFLKHVKIHPGWKAKRRVATDVEKLAHQMGHRRGKVYFVDVIYKPPPQPKKKRAAVKEKKEKKKTEKMSASSKQKKAEDGANASTAIDLHEDADDDDAESPKKKAKTIQRERFEIHEEEDGCSRAWL